MTAETHDERDPLLDSPDSPPDAEEEAAVGEELEDPARDDAPTPDDDERPATMPPEPPTSG